MDERRPGTPGGRPDEASTSGAPAVRAWGGTPPVVGEMAGDAVGPYRLLERLGEGGFGVVWLAERREPFVQRVALKIIKPGMDSRQVLARFEQERQALAVMDHPGVARVLDGGVTPSGRPYFVMEYVKGESITEFCDRHRLTVRERLGLFVPVCEAVQHAHMKGIIHRDLKPGNILVSFTGAGSESDKRNARSEREGGGATTGGRGVLVKVIDFGVAKAVSRTLTEKTIFTEHGQIIGTPEYMSPEQAEMGAVDVDTRTDVYSLGVVLYELLSGALPFSREELLSKGYGEIQRIIREVEPPKPSTRLTGRGDREAARGAAERRQSRVGELARELRRELDWVPLMAMRKDRRERYQSAQAMGEDIRNYLAGRPLVAGPERASYRARKFVRRHRVGVAFTVAAGVLVVGAGGTNFWQLQRRFHDQVNASLRLGEEKARAEREAYAANIAAAGANLELGNVGEAQRRLKLCAKDLRGWEWGHLRWRADWSSAAADLKRQVYALTLSAEGAAAVATSEAVWGWGGGEPGPRRLWNVADAGLPRAPGQRAAAVDAAGRVAIVVVQDGESEKCWVVSPGRAPVAVPESLGADISLSPEGARVCIVPQSLATAAPRSAMLVDPADGRTIATLRGNTAGGWFEGGRRLATVDSRALRVYDAASGELLEERPWKEGAEPNLGPWPRLAMADNGRFGVVSQSDGLRVIDVEARSGARIAPESLTPMKETISGDGGLMAWVERGQVCIHRRTTGRTRRFPVADAPTCLVLSMDGRSLVAGFLSSAVLRWELQEDSPLDWGRGAMGNLTGARGSPWSPGAVVVSTGNDRGTRGVDLAGGGLSWGARLEGASEFAGAVSEDGGAVALATLARVDAQRATPARIVVRGAGGKELGQRAVTDVLGDFQDPFVRAMVFLGSADRLAVVGSSWARAIGDAEEDQEVAVVDLPGGAARKIGVLKDRMEPTLACGGERLAGAAGRALKFWSARSGAELGTVALTHPAKCMAFDRPARRLALGGFDGSVTILGDDPGQAPRVLKGAHRGNVRSVCFTPDGSRLLSGSADGTVTVWDPEAGEALVSLNLESPVLHLCFPGAGARAVAVLESGSVRYLAVRP